MRIWNDPLRRRWILWGLLATVFLLVNIYRLSSAVLFEDLMVAFQTTGVQLGTLHAVFFYVYAVFQIPAGIMADRFGPRLTASSGALAMNLGAIWFAVSGTFVEALAARLLVGLGASVIFISVLRFCANWYRPDEFGTMNGLSFAFSGVGGMLATTPLALVVEWIGWRTTVIGLGLFGLVTAMMVYGLVRNSPTEAGLPAIEGVPDRATMTITDVRRHLVTVLRDRWTWTLSILLFCTSGVNLTLFGLWGIPYVVQTYDVSVTVASTFTLLGSLGLFIGPPVVGWLSDRLDRRTEFIVGGACVYTIALGSLAILSDVPMLAVAAVYFVAGWLLGTFVLSYPIIKERHTVRVSGLSMGTVNGAAFLGASVIPMFMGFALDSYWTGDLVGGVRLYTPFGYRVAFGIAAGCGLIAVGCAIWIHTRKPR